MVQKNEKITFETIWGNRTTVNQCVNPNTNTHDKNWENQCAVRLGFTLEKSGVSFKSFKGARCPYGPKLNGMAARAAEVRDWLMTQPFEGCPKPINITGFDWRKKIEGKTGIVYFSGYWHRDTDGPNVNTGNHIDLWNKNTLSNYWRDVWRSMAGRVGISHLMGYSDPGKSREILFWEIK